MGVGEEDVTEEERSGDHNFGRTESARALGSDCEQRARGTSVRSRKFGVAKQSSLCQPRVYKAGGQALGGIVTKRLSAAQEDSRKQAG